MKNNFLKKIIEVKKKYMIERKMIIRIENFIIHITNTIEKCSNYYLLYTLCLVDYVARYQSKFISCY